MFKFLDLSSGFSSALSPFLPVKNCICISSAGIVVAIFGPGLSFRESPNLDHVFRSAIVLDTRRFSILYVRTTFSFLLSLFQRYSVMILLLPICSVLAGGSVVFSRWSSTSSAQLVLIKSLVCIATETTIRVRVTRLQVHDSIS